MISLKTFNGQWIDSWGRPTMVKNEVDFPASCQIEFSVEKKTQDSVYASTVLVDFTQTDIEDIRHSRLSSGIKMVFGGKLVTTLVKNLRNNQSRTVMENVITLYHRPRNTQGHDQNLLDVLISYQDYCQD